MNKSLTFLSLIFLFWNSVNAQIIGSCGTDGAANLDIRNRMMANREDPQLSVYRSGGTSYVPVSYWLSAKNDGTGRARYINCLINLCAINEIYKDQGIQFYIKSINDLNNSFIYDDPSSQFGAAAIINLNKKNLNAINIFVASKANGSSPGVLAFYSPNEDYIVTDLNYVNSNGTTLGHEIGHFFSLAHTFFGWEAETYDCSVPTPLEHFLNGQRVLVEYVDRAKPYSSNKLHCNVAADGFCDTPADYNLGFGYNGCKYSGCAKDPDGVPLDPDEASIMSYFLNCLKYFSQEQKDAIARDYASSKRNFLKTPVQTALPDVAEAPKNATIVSDGFNAVTFKWDAVPNATDYILEYAQVSLSNAATYKTFLLKRTDTTLTNLNKGIKYAWRVTAFNATSLCPKSTNPLSFTNSNFGVATQDHENIISGASVNSLGNGNYMVDVSASSNQSLRFEVFNLDGRLVHEEDLQLSAGINQFVRSIDQYGIYTYRLHNQRQSFSGKIFAY